MTLLSETNRIAECTLGNTRVRYERCVRSGVVEFSCVPETMDGERVTQRLMGTGPHTDGLPETWQQHQHAHEPEWLAGCLSHFQRPNTGHGRSTQFAPHAPVIPLPPGDWILADTYGWPDRVEVKAEQLHTPPVPAFSGMAARLVRGNPDVQSWEGCQ